MKRDPRRLARLLRVRQIQEQQARAAWAAAEQRARAIEERAEALATEHARASAELAQPGTQRAATWIVAAYDLLDALAARIRETQEEARGVRAEAEALRLPWQLRRQAALGIERLCDRAHEERGREKLKQENKELDETAMRRGAAKQTEERDWT